MSVTPEQHFSIIQNASLLKPLESTPKIPVSSGVKNLHQLKGVH